MNSDMDKTKSFKTLLDRKSESHQWRVRNTTPQLCSCAVIQY